MQYTYLLKNKFLFPYVVGITHRQFELLLPKFSHALRVAEQKKAYDKVRVRDVGGGRKATLKTDRQKLFFILFYYKVFPPSDWLRWCLSLPTPIFISGKSFLQAFCLRL